MYNKHEEIFLWSLVSIAEGTPAFLVREGHNSTVVVRRGHVPNADSVVIDCVYDSKINTVHVLVGTFHNTA